MASIGQTLFRFTGALLLGASATAIDHPVALFAPTVPVQTMPVVLASRDIPEGSIIDRTDVVIAQWPAETVPPGAYIAVDSVDRRVSRVPINKGEAIVPDRLAPVGTLPGLQVKITPGKRAMGLRINDFGGIAGLVRANSRVDVMVVTADKTRPGKRLARLVLENMRVLALGASMLRDADGRLLPNSGVATLEVTPDEAEVLAEASAEGTLRLVLRGYGGPDSLTTKTAATVGVFRAQK